MTAADDDGKQDRAADYDGEGRERAANNDGIQAKLSKQKKSAPEHKSAPGSKKALPGAKKSAPQST
jgi:hypothetical protein